MNSPKHCSWFVLLLIIFACRPSQPDGTHQAGDSATITSPSGLRYEVLQVGSGPAAESGDEVMIRETTTYRDGTVLYSNEDGHAIRVKIGAGMVLAGIDEGLQGMQAGEIRKLILTPELAKRSLYPDHISPDSVLVIKMIVDEVIKAGS